MILSRGSMILSKNLLFWAKVYYFEQKSIIHFENDKSPRNETGSENIFTKAREMRP
jgi:hypothetical protein